jgi:hypothetical protein
LHPLDQGILAVQTAFPEFRESIADWPIGRRNRVLTQVRATVFGGPLRGWTACQQCGEKLEFEVDSRALLSTAEPETDPWIEVDGERYRLPTSRDLAALVQETDPTIAAQRLLQQCSATRESARTQWSEQEIDEVGEQMAAADPLAEIRLTFDCPVCGAGFEENLDLPAFLWTEMEARAKRLLAEVHLIASAYGWSEAEILGLSRARRDFYLDMVRA